MSSPLIGTAEYPDIRGALDSTLNEAELSNTIIGQSIHIGAAIDEVIARYPTAESETDAAKVKRLKRAAILITAARLAPVVARITALTITKSDTNFSKQVFDPTKRATELRALAEIEFAALLEPSASPASRPTMFSLATGRRGQ